IEGVVLSVTDISALDHVRGRLRQLSAIVESSDDAIIGKALDGTITAWNRGAERLYGYSSAEAIGASVKILAPPGHTDQITGFLDALRRGERVENVEAKGFHKNGTVLDLSVTVSPILDSEGTMLGASSIARNITHLKSIERELLEREARIRLLLDSTAEAI